MNERSMREQARLIWAAGVDAVRPGPLVRAALGRKEMRGVLEKARRILVLGGGKAGAAMAAAVEETLVDSLDRLEGWVNVPAGTEVLLKKIHLHPARPAGSNQPTAEGVRGTEEILRRARQGGDVALCLISGGGSALLPAPAPGISLEDKQEVTRRLHASGATIHEMNAVRKHLSAIKGGRLAQAFAGEMLFSLLISDVIGDPLDVIASGPTAPDPTTFADALAVLNRFGLREQVPPSVVRHLEEGVAGLISETPKTLPDRIHNFIIGNNRTACDAAWAKAEQQGYKVISLGQPIAGEAAEAARLAAERTRQVRGRSCLLGGGETTVRLSGGHGKGGRNQEWVLAALCSLGEEGMKGVVLLSGGTDGEDGPTDAAGALADEGTLRRAREKGLDPEGHLRHHDAYPFFQETGDLLVTGLTNTNVMDVLVILVDRGR